MRGEDLIIENERLRREASARDAQLEKRERELSLKNQEIEEVKRALDLKEQELRIRDHKIRQLLHRIYGRKRERLGLPPGPLLPFPEIEESEIEAVAKESRGEDEAEHALPAPRARRRAARLPKNLPRKRVEIDLPAAQKVCTQCHGEMHRMGEEVQEKLNYRPASLFIEETVRPKYACRKCGDRVVLAPLPAQAIDRGFAGAGFVAQTLIAKYSDHIPLHRQEEIYARQGVDLSRSTL